MTSRVYRSPALALDHVRPALESVGVSWDNACHITATRSLASALRDSQARAIPIATLLDLVLLPLWEDADVDSFTRFPRFDSGVPDEEIFTNTTRRWRAFAEQQAFKMELDLFRALRAHARDALGWSEHARLLVDGRREFFRTIQGLEASGFRPGDLTARDEFQKVAIDAWRVLRREVPNLSLAHEILWGAEDRLGQASLSRVLQHVFPATGEASTQIVMHGFYFFTAPQWALFQLIDRSESLDQVFLVHDDGVHPAFTTWRQFFADQDWGLPSIQPLDGVTTELSPRSQTLSLAVSGQPLRPANTHDVSVRVHRNVAEFAVGVDDHMHDEALYSPDHADMGNYVARLCRPKDDEAVDISDLPIGTYILNLHSLVQLKPGRAPRIRIDEKTLRDILSSGYLPVSGIPNRVSLAGVLSRALPFFEGCEDGFEWVERSRALAGLTITDVAALGERRDGLADDERIARHAENPLRVVPWADLTVDEAEWLHRSIHALVQAANDIAEVERVQMGEYLGDMRNRLRDGMEHLTAAESEGLLEKLESAGELDTEIVGVDEVVEVVRLLLGRRVHGSHRDPDPDDTERNPEGGGFSDRVRPMRDLDVLAYVAADRALHLANLSDRSFPRAARSVGWPFALSCLDTVSEKPQLVSRQIMQAREDQAGLSDSYLLHLALSALTKDGTPQRLRLSYIETLERQPRNLSPLVTLLTAPFPDTADYALINDYLGGVPAARDEFQRKDSEDLQGHIESDVISGLVALPAVSPIALATAVVCERRFAIQWALGPTASYRARHHFTIVFGNIIRALVALDVPRDRARGIADDLWRFVTRGQRRSSENRASVLPRNVKPWLATIGGSYGPTYRQAYDYAKSPNGPLTSLAAPSDLLPPGVHQEAVCRHCPVKDRCLDAAL